MPARPRPAQQVREPRSPCENIRGLPSETFCHPLPFRLGRHPAAAAEEIVTVEERAKVDISSIRLSFESVLKYLPDRLKKGKF